MYWVDAGFRKIQRANLNGSEVEDLVQTPSICCPAGIALDIEARKIYWAESGVGKIQRANLDGSTVEDLVTGVGTPLVKIAMLLTDSLGNRVGAETRSDGVYAFPNRPNGTYTVAPDSSHASTWPYDFTPASRSVTVSGSDVSGIDFVATAK